MTPNRGFRKPPARRALTGGVGGMLMVLVSVKILRHT